MTELIKVDGKSIEQYSRVEAGLTSLREKYADVVFDVSTSKGLDEAKKARAEIREPRYEAERLRKALKAPALAYSKLIDAEAARITGELEKLEAPIDAVIKAEEDRKEQERQARIAAENARIGSLQKKVAGIRALAVVRPGTTSAAIDAVWNQLTDIEITEAEFSEFMEAAARAKQDALDQLREAYIDAMAREQEADRLRQEREALERLRAEQEERERAAATQRAEQDRIAREAREAEQAELQRQRDELAAQHAELARQREAADRQAAEQQRELDRQRREQEEREAAARRAEEVRIEKERQQKQEAERADLARRDEAARQDRLKAERRARGQKRPTDTELIEVIATYYDIDAGDAAVWLASFSQQEKAA